ncbi:esterase family protein [Paenalkalicoccus suaedae]|uniref:Esterase family protein n=1 Tax=Paenalkalicoccus suaedae TaxID=2592382 RepID=A0A859FJM2_9BACI|nr:alpha/beta hydrolase family protein [Paenalkalicoccus suaedae]QKS73005.1 esterase family protein [Paenalkalicoccus suaedae]
MALFQTSFKSKALMMQTSVNILLPVGMNALDPTTAQNVTYERKTFPVLYLLHGATDDHSCWLRLSSIERYAEEKGIAVVMPNADFSAYVDMAHGNAYGTYIGEELPSFIESVFPVSTEPKDRFIAGLSMGGYGAFRFALNHPDRFAAAGSFSGALDMASRLQMENPFTVAFGENTDITGTNNDLLHLLRENKAASLPRLYQSCGTEDFLYEDNLTFKKVAEDSGVALTYSDGPGGHEWNFWDKEIKRFLDWI